MSERRYITIGTQLVDDPYSATTATEVLMPEDDRPQPTGLFDALGRQLYRVRDTVPIGFHGRAKA